MGMKTLLKILMLALVLVVVFVPPLTIGIVLYYLIFPLLFFVVFLFFLVSHWVSDRDVAKVRSEGFAFSLFCAQEPALGEGEPVRGRLVFSDKDVTLYRRIAKGRTRRRPCEPVWSLAVEELATFAVGKVYGGKRGITLFLHEGSVQFSSWTAHRKKDAIVTALGWDDIPVHLQRVDVEGEAASSPSFHELDEH